MQRVQAETIVKRLMISYALSDLRALIGKEISKYMELFRVRAKYMESGPRIARLHRITITEPYWCFSATRDSDSLVVMPDLLNNEVRVHRLRDGCLKEIIRISLRSRSYLLSLADRLLATESDGEVNSVTELEMNVARL